MPPPCARVLKSSDYGQTRDGQTAIDAHTASFEMGASKTTPDCSYRYIILTGVQSVYIEAPLGVALLRQRKSFWRTAGSATRTAHYVSP